jgi:hypothetical protein
VRDDRMLMHRMGGRGTIALSANIFVVGKTGLT